MDLAKHPCHVTHLVQRNGAILECQLLSIVARDLYVSVFVVRNGQRTRRGVCNLVIVVVVHHSTRR